MSWASWLVWGFGATVLLTAMLATSQAVNLTRMNIPYMLGTMFTPDRDRARIVGTLVHLINGWIFALLYIATFHVWGGATWWRGMLVGFVHAAGVLTFALPVLPSIHPRMASEERGPTVTRQLEPPGFAALHYGLPTPVSVVLAHVAFGAILGTFCHA